MVTIQIIPGCGDPGCCPEKLRLVDGTVQLGSILPVGSTRLPEIRSALLKYEVERKHNRTSNLSENTEGTRGSAPF